MKRLRVLELFAGIGGFGLGLERAGMKVVGQVEIDEYCQKILEKHWPKVSRWSDIRHVTVDDIRRRCGRVDLICGGFPCQDISTAGKGAGIVEGERSGLWREMWRIIKDVRPAWVLIENVPALKVRGADGVFAALESNRVHLLSDRGGCLVGWKSAPKKTESGSWQTINGKRRQVERLADSDRKLGRASGIQRGRRLVEAVTVGSQFESRGELVNADCQGLQGGVSRGYEETQPEFTSTGFIPDTNCDTIREQPRWCCGTCGESATFPWPACPGEHQHEWEEPRTVERQLGRTTNGLPRGLDKHRLKALGNAVVPQIVQLFGEWIMEQEN